MTNLRWKSPVPVPTGDPVEDHRNLSAWLSLQEEPQEGIQWDDLRIAPSSNRLTGSPFNPATPAVYANGQLGFAFSSVTLEYVWFVAQLPHGYREGTDIFPHVHWFPPIAGGVGEEVRWELQYSFANPGDVFPTASTIAGSTPAVGDITVQFDHIITPLGAISGADKEISAVLLCGFSRTPADAADTYGNDAALIEVDFHYEISSLGSTEQFIK